MHESYCLKALAKSAKCGLCSLGCARRFSSKKRKPAWTDRILWRVRPEAPPSDENSAGPNQRSVTQPEEDEEYPLKLRQDLYTSNMEFSISDHKPVLGVFTLTVRNFISVCVT